MRLSLRFLAFLFAIPVCGCVPALTTYYKPDSATGKRVHEECSFAPSNVWRVTADKATVSAQMNGHSLRFSISIQPGSQASLVTTDIHVDANGRTQLLTLVELSYDNTQRQLERLSAHAVLEGGALSMWLGKDVPREYSSWLQLPVLADEYEVRLPDIVVDGERHEIGPIHFSKNKGAGLFFVNC